MEGVVFVTGNPDKAKELEMQLGTPVEQHALDLYEVQSLDLREILEAKAREAYKHIQKPVIVDDASVVFTELNGLPGPLVKWFMKSIGNEGLCRLADLTKNRTAVAEVGIGYCNGEHFEAFIVRKNGVISKEPRGTNGYGWDAVFIQEGYDVTRAELDDEEYRGASIRKPALDALRSYLNAA
jgi:non-canonical purine NTP pyrophosphatase (RdgB/HAM1 family)